MVVFMGKYQEISRISGAEMKGSMKVGRGYSGSKPGSSHEERCVIFDAAAMDSGLGAKW